MKFLFIVVIVGLATASMFWHNSRSRELLEHWAEQNGYFILEAKYASLFRGPFFWTSSKGQTVYRVMVQERNGFTRRDWVRCGSWLWGIWSKQAQASWDDK